MFEYLIYSACGKNRVRKINHVILLFPTVQAGFKIELYKENNLIYYL